ncbi:MAG: hypothetical protein IKN43_01985 [Selenomonadaceae bacterium]|nr:hypothetical protein [Selenomonadaceae bacterium]
MLQKTKELTTPNEKGFMMLKNFNANDTIAKEMEGLTTVFEKIKMPSGDTTVFQMPSENPEEPKIAKEF